MIDTSNREKINIKDKKVTILGLGLSGTSAAKLANHMGDGVVPVLQMTNLNTHGGGGIESVI